MDYVSSSSSFLPFDQNIDDLFEPFSFPNFSPDELLLALSEDLDTDNFLVNQSQNHEVIISGSRRKTPEINTPGVSKNDQNQNQNQDPPQDNKKRKIIHRDLERQRRQEMTSLYASLKALLPPEYLKGKRSTSDHMNQAIKYIKDQRNKIKDLTEKKTTLMSNSSNSSSSFVVVPPQCLEGYCLEDSVVVRPCVGGAMEVVISTFIRHSLPLSGVLRALIQQGLTIVHCISTKADQKLLHTIVFEVSDGRVIDPFQLQKKLEEFAMHSSRIDFEFETQTD